MRKAEMSTEVTPDLLRRVSDAWEGNTASDDYVRNQMRAWANRLEREQRPLPTVPGWYPTIVVERGGQSCTGALLADDDGWRTAREVGGCYGHWTEGNSDLTIRWAEQDGKTPGQTVYEVWAKPYGFFPWSGMSSAVRDRYERAAAAVLAAHGTPTLTDGERAEEYLQGWAAHRQAGKPASPTLTPVGEHPEPGTRGLLPVVAVDNGLWETPSGWVVGNERNPQRPDLVILADPRPDGAL